MALIARHAQLRNLSVPVPNLPRPGRRALSLTLGLAPLLLLVDAVLHPHTIVDLWTIRQVERLTVLDLPSLVVAGIRVPSLASWVSIVVLGLAAVAFGLRTRQVRSRTSAAPDGGAGETITQLGPRRRSPEQAAPPTPIRRPARATNAPVASDRPCRAA
ncbi:MAG: hypothetical protein QOF01_4471 [Thermomicrobiales bacterium]|jgi:hypothetical protein|nr:hypothetical protein [Thermomicrobiales bacterium]MEA2598002.1 hypothetical protein [Thermomicrobiales bacterium]